MESYNKQSPAKLDFRNIPEFAKHTKLVLLDMRRARSSPRPCYEKRHESPLLFATRFTEGGPNRALNTQIAVWSQLQEETHKVTQIII